MNTLTFSDFHEANQARNLEVFEPCQDWSPTDWATALAGECGEACNLVKKLRRGEVVKAEDIGRELADVICYADLLATRLGINLVESLVQKFNEVSERKGSAIRL